MKTRTIVRTLVTGAVLAGALAGGAAHAQSTCVQTPVGKPICVDLPTNPNPLCRENPRDPTGDQQRDPLCATGPAECIAYGMYLAVDPTVGLPGGASTSLARSHARTDAWTWGPGYSGADSNADAATQRADLPGTLGEGVVESECYAHSGAHSQGWYHGASGRAAAARLSLDLNGYGVPVTLSARVLEESGYASTGPVGANTASIADVVIDTPLTGPIPIWMGMPANSVVPLGSLGDVYVNEQVVTKSAAGCPVYSGDALRLVLNNPLGGTVTLILSWVSNAAC